MDNMDITKLLGDSEFIKNITTSLKEVKSKYSPEVQLLLDRQAEELLVKTNKLLLTILNETKPASGHNTHMLSALATLRGTLI